MKIRLFSADGALVLEREGVLLPEDFRQDDPSSMTIKYQGKVYPFQEAGDEIFAYCETTFLEIF